MTPLDLEPIKQRLANAEAEEWPDVYFDNSVWENFFSYAPSDIDALIREIEQLRKGNNQ